jgi:hypothetical protein
MRKDRGMMNILASGGLMIYVLTTKDTAWKWKCVLVQIILLIPSFLNIFT